MAFSYAGGTAGYAAGAATNDTVVSYALEPTFGVAPAATYQFLRLTGESFRPRKTRARPDEINPRAEVSQAVTTQEACSGTLSGALSTGTYDGLLAGVMGNDFDGNGLLANDSLVKAFTVRRKIGPSWFHELGSFVNRAQITLQQGQFATCSFDFLCAGEEKALADIATDTVPAPIGSVHDTVKGFGGVTIAGIAPNGRVRQVAISLERSGAAQDYAMGAAVSTGLVSGRLLATGSIQLFFKTFDEYDKFVAETGVPIVVSTVDATGNGYAFTFLNATLQNPQINAGGVNQTVVASFDIEGNPQGVGGTFTIAKIPAPTGG